MSIQLLSPGLEAEVGRVMYSCRMPHLMRHMPSPSLTIDVPPATGAAKHSAARRSSRQGVNFVVGHRGSNSAAHLHARLPTVLTYTYRTMSVYK